MRLKKRIEELEEQVRYLSMRCDMAHMTNLTLHRHLLKTDPNYTPRCYKEYTTGRYWYHE